MELTLALPDELAHKLEGAARERGVTVEEAAVALLSGAAGVDVRETVAAVTQAGADLGWFRTHVYDDPH